MPRPEKKIDFICDSATAGERERERERWVEDGERDRRKEDLQLRRRRLIVLKVETAIELASFTSCSIGRGAAQQEEA